MFYLAIIFFSFATIFLIVKYKKLVKPKNKNLLKFKKRLLSKETNIEKIFLRQEEKTSLDPNINIVIGIYENDENVNRKSNIHRARLSKFKKSKLNGEMIFIDQDQNIFKNINGKKKYI